LPQVSLTQLEVQHTQHGRPLKFAAPAMAFGDSAFVRMRDQVGTLIAVGSYDLQAQLLRPRVVLS
jgi:hypothetical protein